MDAGEKFGASSGKGDDFPRYAQPQGCSPVFALVESIRGV
jgi:hypothetical protein